jgi:ABC-type nitrate/sulfonate/bicarbonate transport system permease component
MQEIVLGFLMATVISVPLGYVIVSIRILEKAVYPVIVFEFSVEPGKFMTFLKRYT